MAPRYSVILPIYNIEAYLSACIESVLVQRNGHGTPRPDMEIILVDDGSPDRCGEICDRYAQEHAQIRVIHQQNAGLASARNSGLDAASGEYVLFVDGDDLWHDDLLLLLDPFTGEESDVILFGYEEYLEPDPGRKFPLPIVPQGESGAAWVKSCLSVGKLPPWSAWCSAYRRRFLLESGLRFDERLRDAEDMDFSLRSYPLAARMNGVFATPYRYRIRAGSMSRTASLVKVLDDLRVAANGYDRFPGLMFANNFCNRVHRIAELSDRADMDKAEAYVRSRSDIIDAVKGSALHGGELKLLYRLFGYRRGAQLFLSAVRAKHALLG